VPPTTEIVSLVVDIVHLRQAGVPRPSIEYVLVEERGVARSAARRLIGHVDHELQVARRRMGLKLALTAESLRDECIELRLGQPSPN
jgi:hypothetical protein